MRSGYKMFCMQTQYFFEREKNEEKQKEKKSNSIIDLFSDKQMKTKKKKIELSSLE